MPCRLEFTSPVVNQLFRISERHSASREQGAEYSVFDRTLGIFLAPFQRLPDEFVLVRASKMTQKSLASFLVNEHSERTAFRTSPSVQLDRKVAVINRALKRWRIPQIILLQQIHVTPLGPSEDFPIVYTRIPLVYSLQFHAQRITCSFPRLGPLAPDFRELGNRKLLQPRELESVIGLQPGAQKRYSYCIRHLTYCGWSMFGRNFEF
jgi:hypothetical protein